MPCRNERAGGVRGRLTAARPPRRLALILLAAMLAACAVHHPTVTPTHPSSTALNTDLGRIFDAPAFSDAFWGVVVESADTGEPLYLRNADKLMLPASNMKILTLAAAVDRLTWHFQYDTRLLATGPIGDGTLHGDLVVIGSGDPTLGELRITNTPKPTLDAWADRLWTSGLRRIDGRVIGDGRALRSRPFGSGWAWDDLVYGYAAPVSALQYHDNLAVLTIRAGSAAGQPVALDVAPAETGLTLVNDLATTAPGGPASIVLQRDPGSRIVTLIGRVPAGSPEIYRTAAVPDPPAFLARSLRAALVARGIEITGPATDIEAATPPPDEAAAQILLTAQSLPLSGMAPILMKDSENLYAETLLRTIAIVAPPADGSGVPGIVRDLLTRLGLPPAGAVVADGSGLSRDNLVTARTLAGILRHYRGDQQFVEALAVAGDDGTLTHRFAGTAAAGKVYAKTGSMSHVRALSGYLTTRDGRPLVFSILVNNFEAPPAEVTAAIDAAVLRLIGG
ncbi:MAG TPA: D-alanyl-D-alanine carboxypeptidase/D-alanyl-D-alanine-endopeptidase [Vicinamibacterales bacterium]|jgi:D-alanyl-D-alanine carboxypeptidase/D-alanyl-D-alanine-endopeptidase (penicillin-binding protein 4)